MTTLRCTVSAVLILWLLTRVDVVAALALLTTARWIWLVAAVVSVLATHGVNCWRWRCCLLDEGRQVSFRTLVVSYWTSLFAGMVLPTEYGGDLLRVKDLWGRVATGSTAAVSVAWSRLSGFAATFFLLSLVGLWRLERLAEMSMVWVWVLSVAMCVMLAAIVFSPAISDHTARCLRRLPTPVAWGERLRRVALSALERTRALAAHRSYGLRIAALALIAQALMVVTNTLYARALGQPITILDMALVVPIVTLSSLLPVSLGGIGVKEGAFVVCLSTFGLTPEGALSVALLNRLVFLALALAGGCLFPFRERLLTESRQASADWKAGRER